ncbi:hypothetical protein OG883_18750 [Streptomyces sp. NBC_01142]|uniref:hypothetical protein n=1 Tax=Streptomyces sp. NBC_01142 TaxID=2975865 RepID=UPI0022524D96|nr:hypothetical protein [Streptomyces sp. NBC_01142]MCX4821887.1 hypothetical protein [Streptomyces sp. NBC_01142]
MPALIRQSAEVVAAGGLVCLTGVGSLTGRSAGGIEDGSPRRPFCGTSRPSDPSTPTAAHYYLAAREFARAEPSRAERGWLEGLVTRRIAPRDIDQALDRDRTGIKVMVDFAS